MNRFCKKAFLALFFIALSGVTLHASHALRELVRANDADGVQAFLDDHDEQEARSAINKKSKRGFTALLLAAKRKNPEIVEMLAQAGGDSNAYIMFDGKPKTALDFLIEPKRRELLPSIRLLLRGGGMTGEVLAKRHTLFEDFLSYEMEGEGEERKRVYKFDRLLGVYETEYMLMGMEIKKRFHLDYMPNIPDVSINMLRDETGKTLLHHAAHAADVQVIKKLVEKGAYIDVQDNDLQTPMYSLVEGAFADKGRNVEVYEKVATELYDLGANLKVKDKNYRSPSQYASYLFRSFFVSTTQEAVAMDEDSEEKLERFLNAFRQLVLMSRDIRRIERTKKNEWPHRSRRVPRYIDSVGDFDELKTVLPPELPPRLGEIAEPYYVERAEDFPLSKEIFRFHEAIRKNDQEAFERILVGEDFHIEQKDDDGKTPLYVAVEEENVEMARRLLQAGANPNVIEPSVHRTPLHVAARKGNLELVQLLVTHGANVLVRDRNGFTPSNMVGWDVEELDERDQGIIIDFLGQTFEEQEMERESERERERKRIQEIEEREAKEKEEREAKEKEEREEQEREREEMGMEDFELELTGVGMEMW